MKIFSRKTIILIVIVLMVLLCLALATLYWLFTTQDQREHSRVVFQEHCSSCHGADLRGSKYAPNLLVDALKYGDDIPSLERSIVGLGGAGRNTDNIKSEAHSAVVLPDDGVRKTVRALALYISERRQKFPTLRQSYFHESSDRPVSSKHHQYKVEKFADLAGRPYAIAPLPDGRILVSEKVRGLSIVDTNGQQQPLISGTPAVHDQLLNVQGSYLGWGQMLDIALHPAFGDKSSDKNGNKGNDNDWIYLSFTDRCQFDCSSLIPQTMVKVVRAKLNGNQWVEEELIWSVHKDYYTAVPDGVACGRLAFDNSGYLYITVGGKASYKWLHDMDTPYGKVHRVRDDGQVPQDNPFWLAEGVREDSSTRHTVWSYGHRTAQGLEGHPATGEIWSTEMGPRGGDEINKIIGGENYGWPLFTNGLNYNAKEISIGKDLGLDFPIKDTQLPVFDFTPAPALSNITFYTGSVFKNWQHDMLVSSLKAMSLYRLRIEDDQVIEQEIIVDQIGRIRDVITGADGLIYLAIEYGDDSGSIYRIAP